MKIAMTCMIVLSLILPLSVTMAEDMPKTELKSFDVARVTLTEPAVVKAEGKSKTYTEGYLIRLHGDFAIHSANSMQIRIGNESIEEYGGLTDGLYFIVLDRARLDRMANQPIKYRFGKADSWREMGKILQLSSFDLETAKKEMDALKAE